MNSVLSLLECVTSLVTSSLSLEEIKLSPIVNTIFNATDFLNH